MLGAGTLAACSGGDNGSEAGTPEPAADGPVDLRMTVWTANEDQLALFDEIAADYIEENPDLVSSVEFEVVPFADYTTTLTTQLAGGNTPDLAWIFESNAPEFVQSGALADIKPALEGAEGYEYDDLLPSALELWSAEDGLYAYPFSNSPFAMFVNTDRIAEAGQPNPGDLVDSDEWTYDAAREISAATTEQLGGAGLVVRDFDYSIWSNLATVWGGWGASAWSADGTTCGFTEPEMVEAMTWFHDAVFTDGAIPGPGTSADFFAGDVTMTITQISRASSLDGSFEWDLLPLPAGPEGQQNVIGQAGIGVFENGENPDVAADFLAHFTSPESAEKLATYFPPPRESLLTADVLATANPLLSEEQLQSVVVEGIQDATTKPAHANFAQLETTIRGELDALWTEGADVEAVLNDVCAAAEPLLQG
ncbi:ABC transporter substrate-binding protein [Georgenia subflava]|uniref:Extracellular solute-binding protein n=2 Tax=Georgenia subflava TaxID=1622177 RepID=A0A6N7EFL3_9MICO|nr:extracellular solute-binding protein [Georgenia subflava]